MQTGTDNSNNGSFMDFKTILAILLVGFVWIGWQNYLQEKYPEAYKQELANDLAAEKTETPDKEKANNSTVATAENKQASKTSPTLAQPAEKVEKSDQVETLTTFQHENWSFDISSKGMSLKNIRIKSYTDRENQPIELGSDERYFPFETNIVGRAQSLDFKVSKVSDVEYKGVANVNGVNIHKTIVIDPDTYSVKMDIELGEGARGSIAGFVTYLTGKIEKIESSMLLPQFSNQDFYVAHGTTTSREILSVDQTVTGKYTQAQIASIGSQYFAMALVDQSSVLPDVEFIADGSKASALAILNYSILNRARDFKISYTGYMGPKDLPVLRSVNEKLDEIVDFGWFSSLAGIIFDLLQWFNSIFNNYGLAVIFLTLLMRILVLPLYMMSYKSMKMMQVLQPQIKALREKYKDDKETLNKEMMLLMRENKANPLGGCLPMLLQFPVFIALYRVLAQSIDLYKAPFAFWIQDLSLKDPYFVLPVLMAVAMYFQTKLTPSTMDPAQQKVMMFMPVMFAFFMAGLPSGLTLYMFVSTLFGILQQLYFMRDKKTELTTTGKEVKA